MASPLPFTPFEELMLYQDSRAYPASCFLRLQFQGRLQPEALAAAARVAIARHPLLQATADLSHGQPHWRFLETDEPDIVWRETAVVEEAPPASYMDLRSSSALRLIVHADPEQSDLLLQFHHAACDGLGIRQFMNDLLLAYTNETSGAGRRVELPELDRRLLLQRGSLKLTTREFLAAIPAQAVGLLGVRQFLMRTPQPVLPHEPVPAEGEPPSVYPSLVAHHFDSPTTAALKLAARQAGVTVNDMLARDLFLTLHDFRDQRQLGDAEDWLRLMIPVSLRGRADRKAPAANIVSSVFLDRRAADLRDPQRLLASVKEEIDLIKRLRLGLTLILSLRAQRWLPGGIRAAARKSRCQTSAVLTNVGKLFGDGPLKIREGWLRCGNVVLDKASIAAPIAPYMCAAFAATTYADRLTITLHYDPRPLPPAAAKELLDTFIERIQHSAGVVSLSPLAAQGHLL